MAKFSDLVPLSSITPFNVGLSSASETTMISVLGRPQMPLSTDDQPDHASDTVMHLAATQTVIGKVRCTGIKPALDGLRKVLTAVNAQNPDLIKALRSSGMLVVRLRRPTSGRPSSQISNHAWGTAIDFSIEGNPPVGNTGKQVPRGIAMLVPFFNAEGWFSGIAFHDDTHFEVSEEKIRTWAKDGTIPKAQGVA